MISASLQRECVDKILRSEEFTGSATYKSYLTYLVDAKAAGKSLKENTIAIEFFGKSSDFNPAEDLVLALKLPGPLNNSIFIIASYHSLGAPEISNYLVNPSTRFDLEKNFKKNVVTYHNILSFYFVLPE